jgi:hypothetical protein
MDALFSQDRAACLWDAGLYTCAVAKLSQVRENLAQDQKDERAL